MKPAPTLPHPPQLWCVKPAPSLPHPPFVERPSATPSCIAHTGIFTLLAADAYFGGMRPGCGARCVTQARRALACNLLGGVLHPWSLPPLLAAGDEEVEDAKKEVKELEDELGELKGAEAVAIKQRDIAEAVFKGQLAFEARGAAQKALRACSTKCQSLRATVRRLEARHATACRRVERLERDPPDAERAATKAAAAANARAEARARKVKEREGLNKQRAQDLADDSDGKLVNYSESGGGRPLGSAGVYGGVRCSVQTKKVPHPHHPERKVSARAASYAEWHKKVHDLPMGLWLGLHLTPTPSRALPLSCRCR